MKRFNNHSQEVVIWAILRLLAFFRHTCRRMYIHYWMRCSVQIGLHIPSHKECTCVGMEAKKMHIQKTFVLWFSRTERKNRQWRKQKPFTLYFVFCTSIYAQKEGSYSPAIFQRNEPTKLIRAMFVKINPYKLALIWFYKRGYDKWYVFRLAYLEFN